ncbi:uncharacterized protein LOC133034431 [Cannabis sativa]|uniref:uncharacterized protein LOC133034431 n=1 Tax=Cannabis sativa TaxID=3483 RepID=UPI0029C9DF28|nr:uncharacterized protein LOC133034431 [Cannabis sativa]
MTVALLARNKIQFVNRKLSQPDEDYEDYDAWNRCNCLVVSWLLHSISQEICESIMYMDVAADIWDDLQERFRQRNAPRIFQAKRSMQLLNQGAMDVTTYFTRRKALWDLIQEYRPLPPCQCGAMKIIQGYQEEDKVLEILIGLNESNSNVRSRILMQEPPSVINRAYASVIQEERQREICFTNAETSKDTNTPTAGSSND